MKTILILCVVLISTNANASNPHNDSCDIFKKISLAGMALFHREQADVNFMQRTVRNYHLVNSAVALEHITLSPMLDDPTGTDYISFSKYIDIYGLDPELERIINY